MRRLLLFLSNILLALSSVMAQQTRSLSEEIHTVRVVVDDDPLLPPIASLDSRVEISFDSFSHT